MVILGIVFNNMVVDMKANEFFKKHGWEAATNAVNSTSEKETAFFETKNIEETKGVDGTTVSLDVKVYRVSYLDVKKPIESHELINELGGLNCVKFKLGLYDSVSVISRLKQAITDVESCQ